MMATMPVATSVAGLRSLAFRFLRSVTTVKGISMCRWNFRMKACPALPPKSSHVLPKHQGMASVHEIVATKDQTRSRLQRPHGNGKSAQKHHVRHQRLPNMPPFAQPRHWDNVNTNFGKSRRHPHAHRQIER
jgi:hypothetical protein